MAWGANLILWTERAVVGRRRRTNTFLPLPAIAEPNSHHLLFESETIGDSRDVERGGFRLGLEVSLERVLGSDADGRPSLAASLGGLLLFAVRSPRLLGFLQPLLQDWLQLLGVFEAELEIFKPADGCLAEVGPLDLSQSLANVCLGEAQLDAPLLETGCKLLEVFDFHRVRVGSLGRRDAPWGGGAVRALDDGLIRHGSDGRTDLDAGGGNESRGSASRRRGLYEGGRRHMQSPAAVGKSRVEREGDRDASERRRLQLEWLACSQHCGRHGETWNVSGRGVVVADDGRYGSLVAVQKSGLARGVRGGDARRTGSYRDVRALERWHGGGGALERAADLLRRSLGGHSSAVSSALSWVVAVHGSFVCWRLLRVRQSVL